MNAHTITATSLPATRSQKPFACSDLVSIRDLGPEGVKSILQLAKLIKARPADFRNALAGKQVVMFFEKPSLRTRLTFAAGVATMGGTSHFVDQTQERLDARESLNDIAHNLERWMDAIVLRTFSQATIEGMAEFASIPVINALSDHEHPCQALTDYLTLEEHKGDPRNLTMAYVGDGNNVAHSLILTAACLGSTIRIATPAGYAPDSQVVAEAQSIAEETGAVIELFTDPVEAVDGVDAIYTDAWASMGQEHTAEQRAQIFPPYQVNDELISHAAPGAVVMHCLPAHRNEEITDAVIDSARSIVFDQAENRLHVQKAILHLLIRGGKNRMPARSAHV